MTRLLDYSYNTQVEMFTEGDCWVLADEIHKALGWGLVLVGFPDEETWELLNTWEHAAVRRPDGAIIDIEGIHSEADFLQRWGRGVYGYAVHDVNPEEWEIAITGMEPMWSETPDLARKWVKDNFGV